MVPTRTRGIRIEIKALARLAVQENGELSASGHLVHGGAGIRTPLTEIQSRARDWTKAFIKLPVVNRPHYSVENAHLEQRTVSYQGVCEQACLHGPAWLQHVRDVSTRCKECRVTRECPLHMFITDIHTARVPLRLTDVLRSALLIHDSSLLEVLITPFERIWTSSAPLAGVGPHIFCTGGVLWGCVVVGGAIAQCSDLSVLSADRDCQVTARAADASMRAS
ncbi:hypothetical protein ABZS83_07990 [Streptomyces sp. NPDC005426]|uniref:hypothetical protein n=1 Tax=Streptomyces sp. NPDC005426 TaxID=3155344 RepID=UPI0033AEDD3C